MFSYTKRDTFNSDGYSEIVNPSWFIDNRTEFIFAEPHFTINTGLEEKFQSTNAYDDFFFEPVNVWDLSSKSLRSTLNYVLSKNDNGFVHVMVPGWPGRTATQGIINNDTNQSEASTASPFFQSTWMVTDKFNIVRGAHGLHAHPDEGPVHPEHRGLARGGRAQHEPERRLQGNAHRLERPLQLQPELHGDLADGAASASTPTRTPPAIPRGLFSEQSQLVEAGLKFNVMNDKLFVSTDVFDQSRQYKPQASPAIQYRYYGAEPSMNYQPDKHFFATIVAPRSRRTPPSSRRAGLRPDRK